MEEPRSEHPTDEQTREARGTAGSIAEILRLRLQGTPNGEDVKDAPSQVVPPATDARANQPEPTKGGATGSAVRAGTLVFGALSVISLVVGLSKGLPPIYLLEAAGWAVAAWYWQKKKTHSEVSQATVIVLAVLVAGGEVIHIASQTGERFQPISGAPYLKFDTKTAQNCWAGGPGERNRDQFGHIKTVDTPPHVATCSSLKNGGNPVMADSIYIDKDENGMVEDDPEPWNNTSTHHN